MSDKQLWAQEDYVHVLHMGTEKEKRYSLGYNEPYQTFASNLGQLYRACLKEHGRCVSKVYIGNGKPVGWVFLRKAPDGEPGVVETWITVYVSPPKHHVVWEGAVYPSFQRQRTRAPKKAALVPMIGGGMRLAPEEE